MSFTHHCYHTDSSMPVVLCSSAAPKWARHLSPTSGWGGQRWSAIVLDIYHYWIVYTTQAMCLVHTKGLGWTVLCWLRYFIFTLSIPVSAAMVDVQPGQPSTARAWLSSVLAQECEKALGFLHKMDDQLDCTEITGGWWHLNWEGQAHGNGWNRINGMETNISNTWFPRVR